MIGKKMLTVFTPAYNRAHTIGRTYESLCRQTCQDFEWLVIDDGSSDHTKELVEGWIKENKIPIRYIYQNNQGMHGAHNTAYRNIHTELNTCIDSDDYMPDDAVEKIISFWNQYGSDKYAGFIGLDRADSGDIIGTVFPENVKETTLLGYYEHGGKGDKKLVYRTDVITKYPEYPIFDGEKYVGLAYKYYLIDQDYTLLTCNDVFCIVEYQTDGSSMNMYKQYWRNPKGFVFYRKVRMRLVSSYKRRFIECVHYVSSSIIAKNISFIKESPCKWTTLMALPGGILLETNSLYEYKRSSMNEIIKSDLYRYVGKTNSSLLVQLRYFFFTPGFRYIYFFRKGSLARRRIIRLLWHFFMRMCMYRTGIQIPLGTRIGEGFRIVHFGHIVINPNTKIGKNFNISQGCLIGNSQGKHAGTPIIGDNVCMNANSIIIGGVSIGNNVLIAPGAFINFDVPDNSIVIGNPGKIVERGESPTSKYIVNPIL